MAAHPRNIRLTQTSYELLMREARRRGVEPDFLADELLRSDLSGGESGDLDRALSGLAELRNGLPNVDAVALTRAARDDLERRSA